MLRVISQFNFITVIPYNKIRVGVHCGPQKKYFVYYKLLTQLIMNCFRCTICLQMSYAACSALHLQFTAKSNRYIPHKPIYQSLSLCLFSIIYMSYYTLISSMRKRYFILEWSKIRKLVKNLTEAGYDTSSVLMVK